MSPVPSPHTHKEQMTQRNQSDDRRLHKLLQRCLTTRRLASSLPAQTLCWLSSFSLLSGGFVFAQVDSSVDNIVPTVENSQKTVANPVKKEIIERSRRVSTAESTQSTPDFSERRAKLKKRLHRSESVSESPKRSTQSESDEPVTRIRRNRRNNNLDSAPETTAKRFRREVEASRVPAIRDRQDKPEVENSQKPQVNTPSSLPDKPSEVSQPPTQSDNSFSATQRQLRDYNNAYLDPNDYNSVGKGDLQAPNSVVLTERSRGCKTILTQGQGAMGGLCAKIPIARYGNQQLADNQATNKPAPSWIRKSQRSAIAQSNRVRPSEENQANKWHNTRVGPINLNNSGSWRRTLASVTPVSKSEYRPNRFIPKPSSFNLNAIASSETPSSGSLSAPMTADNVAPRASNVDYNIPLASALPQIPYTGAIAANFGGMMFPLSVPATITSLFGWRVHPITGSRRFHSGTDLGAAMGTPILAAATGQVEIADYVGGYGLTVILNHSSAQQSLYGHMSQVFVQPGQVVQQGTVIGRVGSTGNSTGPHLHFEVRHLTSEGWVAIDSGVQLETALSQLIQVEKTAQVIGQPGS